MAMSAVIPRKHDVLLGKGTAISMHHGNEQLRSIVERHRPNFCRASNKAEKRAIAAQIMAEVRRLGGSFLMEHPATTAKRNADNGAGKGKVGGSMYRGRIANVDRVYDNLTNTNPAVDDPCILCRAWVRADDKRVADKIMHRLREKKSSLPAAAAAAPTAGGRTLPRSGGAVATGDVPVCRGKGGDGAAERKQKSAPGSAARGPASNRKCTPGPQASAAKLPLQPGPLAGHPPNNESLRPQAVHPTSIESLRPLASHPTCIASLRPLAGHPTSISSLRSPASHLPSVESLRPRAGHPPNMEMASPQATNTSGVESVSCAPKIVPMSVHDWIRSAVGTSVSTRDYLMGAIALSLALAEHLARLPAAEASVADIAVDGVTILVPQRPAEDWLAVRGVRFRWRPPPPPPPAAHSPPPDNAVCASLGTLLLAIFSMGRWSGSSSSSSAARAGGAPRCAGSDRWEGDQPPAQRRRISAHIEGTAASKRATDILLEVGMPMSICRLVCNLLDAAHVPCQKLAITSPEEALWELIQMKDDPDLFLFNRTCPKKALDDTCLFHDTDRHFVGREEELGILMNARERISKHVRQNMGELNIEITEPSNVDFQCETVFISGYAGSGKSSLLQPLEYFCIAEQWFVLKCKFVPGVVQASVLAKAFDNFFGAWASKNENEVHRNNAMLDSFREACLSIFSTLDQGGLSQLCEMIPNLQKIATAMQISNRNRGSPSLDKVGWATKRRRNLLHVIFKSLCSTGRPVLLIIDDLHWASSFDGLKDLIDDYTNIPCFAQKRACHQGGMLVGTYRDNEMKHKGDAIRTVASINKSKGATVTRIAIGELTTKDITKLISRKLCLPMRYAKSLADVVFSKTRGNPFFIVQFLRSALQRGMLEFSVPLRRWNWDCDAIDFTMISDGVAELLTSRFNQLPHHLMRTLEVTSCLGTQADVSTLDVLHLEQNVPFDTNALQLAILEGLVERAGPIYQFVHDIIHQTVYDSIPEGNRTLLHKKIGETLLRSAGNNPKKSLLAVDQINIYCKTATLSPEERSQFASINAVAAKCHFAESSYEQALACATTAIKMLDTNHWQTQYDLSLELYEMRASISCTIGDTSTMSSCVNDIITNVKSCQDSLTASRLLTALLAASSKYDEAIGICFSVLLTLGEDLPQEVNLSDTLNELSVIQTTLANITVDQVKHLPKMTDDSKLHAMQFMSILCSHCVFSKPMLLPVISCRMVRLTIEAGFCDDSIVGLVTAAYGLHCYAGDIKLAYRICKVGESLIGESPKMHALRSRLSFIMDIGLKAMVEPLQSVVKLYPDRHNSAILAGDVNSAMQLLFVNCGVKMMVGDNLANVERHTVMCIKQLIKCQPNPVIYKAMSLLRACNYLSGKRSNEFDLEIDIKSFEELDDIGVRTNDVQLSTYNFLAQMRCHFWMRDYSKVAELLAKNKPNWPKRPGDHLIRIAVEGITAFKLARGADEAKWRKIGEDALAHHVHWEGVSKWNFEHRARLLEAELHQLKGDFKSADASYNASIVSAREHKFLHHEALALELHGIFYVDNGMVHEGIGKLQLAIEKHKQWGAMTKVEQLQRSIDSLKSGDNR